MNTHQTRKLPENDSQAELVTEKASPGGNSSHSGRQLRNLTIQEWAAVLVLCFVNLINYMDRYTVAGVLTDIQKYYNIGNDRAGLLQTAFIISYMMFAPIFGYLGDRYNRKLLMAAGVFLWSLTTLAGSFMEDYWWFLTFRALVGIGEASYSTIAPTIISDLFADNVRSKILAIFYFAIPVGSGLGYIIGSETASAFGSWHYALRVTPFLGIIAVILLLWGLKEPVRGHSDGSAHLETTSLREDLKILVKNPSFMLSTFGFTCVAFVAGALSWWGPKFIVAGLKLQSGGANSDTTETSTAIAFGCVTIAAGIIGLSLGCWLSATLRRRHQWIDPVICAGGLLISAPLLLASTYATLYNTALCYVLMFFGQVALNLNWSIVCDILLYVVMPTRRSTAEGFQLLVSHAFGDAGSPFLIGVLSEVYQRALQQPDDTSGGATFVDEMTKFSALQYALFTTCFVEVLGAVFFLLNAMYVVRDKDRIDQAIRGSEH